VPNDLFCLSVGSKIIADCGASSSGEAKVFTDGQRSGASGDPAPGRVWAQKSEALITASEHRDQRQHFCRKGLHLPQKFGQIVPRTHASCKARLKKESEKAAECFLRTAVRKSGAF